MSHIRILRAGLCTTVQDLGRARLRHLGVPVSGAMDQPSHRLANRLVGNPDSDATLEMTLNGDEIEFMDETLIAITGADMSPAVIRGENETLTVAQNCPLLLPAGSRIRFHGVKRGCRCYLAIAGGIEVPVVLESRSTFLRAAFGGHFGRMVRAGDELPVGIPGAASECIRKRLMKEVANASHALQPRWFLRPEELPGCDATLRIVLGTHTGRLSIAQLAELQNTSFLISTQSDRMGFRLTGRKLQLPERLELQSEGVSPGTIQLPPDGNPILLQADCAPTGGYPRIGHVISADLGKAAQLAPGSSFKFVVVSLEEAQNLIRQQSDRLSKAIRGMHLLSHWG